MAQYFAALAQSKIYVTTFILQAFFRLHRAIFHQTETPYFISTLSVTNRATRCCLCLNCAHYQQRVNGNFRAKGNEKIIALNRRHFILSGTAFCISALVKEAFATLKFIPSRDA
jgi:hypothetical protein